MLNGARNPLVCPARFTFAAIEGVLGDLGPGGNMAILWLTMQLPDPLFQLFGRWFWVNGGGYATAPIEDAE